MAGPKVHYSIPSFSVPALFPNRETKLISSVDFIGKYVLIIFFSNAEILEVFATRYAELTVLHVNLVAVTTKPNSSVSKERIPFV